MFSICIQSYLFADKKKTHSSHARPKTKGSGKLVGIDDYEGASLEVNDKYRTHLYMIMCNDTFASIHT